MIAPPGHGALHSLCAAGGEQRHPFNHQVKGGDVAGNRLRFEESIQKASDLVWAEKWPEAVRAYERALEEFPDEVSALLGYAWALLNAKRLDKALVVYRKLTKLDPQDPGPFERIAEILEKQGQRDEAAKIYHEAALRYSKQGLSSKFVSNLEASVRLQPHDPQVWAELLQQYQTQADIEKSVLAAVWLAYLYQDEHRDWAIEVCRQAQEFNSYDPRIAQVLRMLQSHQPIQQPPPIGERIPMPDETLGEGGAEEEEEEETHSPVDITRKRALEKLAESIFEEDRPQVQGLSSMEVDLLIGQAIDAQTRGDLEKALSAYERLLEAGVSLPSIHFNLGMLYKEQMRFDEAIPQLEKALRDPEYVLGSHFALGECYQAQGQFSEALQHYLEAVKIVDLGTIQREQADDLIRVYEGLAQSLINTGKPERIQQLGQTLVEFLSQRGWETEALQARKRLDSLAGSGMVLSLAELISLPGSEDILRSVALAQEYQRRRKFYCALEELFHVLSKSPDYLPLHYMLGNLMLDNEQVELGLKKFRMIARTYEIRGQDRQALATYQQILRFSPLDIDTHRIVVDLFIRRGQIDEALNQLFQLADAYYQLAQPDRARDTYAEALKLAPQGSAKKNWKLRILHRIADLDTQRLSWSDAVRDYEQITRISPYDERALIGLFRLYPRIGKTRRGIGALDRLLKHYLEERKVSKALDMLEDLIAETPDNIALRSRAAQLYLNLGRRKEAIEQLDALGDLQLEAGQKKAAVKTIKMILSLDPPNREAYESLYRDMAGEPPPA